MRVTSIWQKILSLMVTPQKKKVCSEVLETVTSPAKREVVGSNPTSLGRPSCSSIGRARLCTVSIVTPSINIKKPVEKSQALFIYQEVLQMAKFQKEYRDMKEEQKYTRNYEGEKVYRMTPEMELYERVLTNLVGEDKFYTKGSEDLENLKNIVQKVLESDPKFVLQLANYARNFMYLRSVPILLLVLASLNDGAKPYVREYTPKIVKRADELAEVISLFNLLVGDIGDQAPKGSLPASLKKGLADTFGNFDEYQFNKYKTGLKDVLRLTHPKPKNEYQNQLYRYLIYDEVGEELKQIRALKKLLQKKEFDAEALELIQESHATWEVAISHFGNKAEVWNALDLPFMAGLRNLRNLLETGAYKALDSVIEKLKDEKEVLKSKQYPFRFLSAYREISGVYEGSDEYKQKILRALETALYLSVQNIPRLSGNTVVIVDTSGSMDSSLSERSLVTYKDIAALIGAISHMISDNAIVIAFASMAKKVLLDKDGSLFENMKKIQETDTGYATYVEEAMELLEKSEFKTDRILLFSDMQVYSQSGTDTARSSISHYLENHGHPFFYSFDLAGYGTSVQNMRKKGIILFSGWSEKMLNYIAMVEKGNFEILEEIKRNY